MYYNLMLIIFFIVLNRQQTNIFEIFNIKIHNSSKII